MKSISKRIKVFFTNIKYAICSLGWKRDPKVILFGSWFGEKFADNSRFLFQYLSDNKEKLGLKQVAWVTRSKDVLRKLHLMGYEVYMIHSEESIKLHKKAKYHIICNSSDCFASVERDILTEYSWGAKRINLWHGAIGFKGVSFASQPYRNKKKRHPMLCRMYEACRKSAFFRKFVDNLGGWGDCTYLTTSEFRTQIMKAFFELPDDHYIETGFPRVSGKVKLLPEEEKIINGMKHFRATVIYLPTFRGKNSTFDFNELSADLKKYLNKNNILWLQKFHSAASDKTDALKINGNIMTLPHDFDINVLTPYITALVTDYSSAGGDAMYYKKPVLFYIPDYEEYKTEDRGFLIDPEEIMCGPKTKTVDEFRKSLDQILNNGYKPDDKYLSVRNKYYAQDKTLEEIWQDIIKGR